MSTASTSQPATVLEFNKCGLFNVQSPERSPNNSIVWDQFVRQYLAPTGNANNHLEPELGNGFNHIRLSGLRRWRAGKEEPKGSALHIEHFLHLRALVQNHVAQRLPIEELVDEKYLIAAKGFLKGWPDFENYIHQVPISDPGVDVDSLGLFAGAKVVQNQVLLDAYLDVSQDGADSFEESISETPLKKGRSNLYDLKFYMTPPANDAADEQIVNEALISFTSALTRKWMVQKSAVSAYGPDQTPTGGASAAQAHDWKTIADWTMSRGRFHIRERIRDNDATQVGHMTGLQAKTGGIVKQRDRHSYGRVLISETDGSLYRIDPNSTETLALVEAKKRLRRKNRLKIEWQEAAEILAWLNLRLRTESEERAQKGGAPLPPRRGLLKPKPKPATGGSGEKSRCLLLAQDREEIYIVIGEWDTLYEQYALEGKLSRGNIERLDQLRAENPPVLDAGFLTLHVYGPFGGFVQNSEERKVAMTTLSTDLLALSLHLSQASCSSTSRRNSPAVSIQLPPHRACGEPCCLGCTCKCGCEPPLKEEPDPFKPPPEAPKPPSDTSGARAGKQQTPREGSASREPGKKTPSIHSSSSHSSGGLDPTPSGGPRPGGIRPDEIRAASAHAQQDPGQGHGSLPLRERPVTSEQQGVRSESQERASRSRSRARAAAAAAAAAGHQGQWPGPAGGSRHPPLPQATGGSLPAPGQQRQPQPQQHQQHEQRDAYEQVVQGTQPHRDPRVAPAGASTQHQAGTASTQPQPRPQTRSQTAGHRQQERHDPSPGPGPSQQTQAGPSRQRPQARPAGIEVGEPSQSQQNPEEAPTRKEKKNHTLSPKTWRFLNIGKDKKDKEGKGKGKGDEKDEGGGGK